jgi:hypothetical protein
MKNYNELSLITKKFKKEADLILKKSDLIKSLSNYGDVYIRGSYELDLMLDGDIDIYVINKKINKDLVIKVLNNLIKDEKFNGYFFYDFYKKTRKNFPKGYYVGLKTMQNKKRWKVDIWFMERMDRQSDNLINSVKEKMNEKTRRQILKLKFYCKNNNINIPSHLIYLAVIEQGITTIKDLKSNLDKINLQ